MRKWAGASMPNWFQIGFPSVPMSSWNRWQVNDVGEAILLSNHPFWITEHARFSDGYRGMSYPEQRWTCNKKPCPLCSHPDWNNSVVGFLTCLATSNPIEIESHDESEKVLARITKYVLLLPIYNEKVHKAVLDVHARAGTLFGVHVEISLKSDLPMRMVRALPLSEAAALCPPGYSGVDLEAVLGPPASYPNPDKPWEDDWSSRLSYYPKTKSVFKPVDPMRPWAFSPHVKRRESRLPESLLLKPATDFLSIVPTDDSIATVDGKILPYGQESIVCNNQSILLEDISSLSPLEKMLKFTGSSSGGV